MQALWQFYLSVRHIRAPCQVAGHVTHFTVWYPLIEYCGAVLTSAPSMGCQM